MTDREKLEVTMNMAIIGTACYALGIRNNTTTIIAFRCVARVMEITQQMTSEELLKTMMDEVFINKIIDELDKDMEFIHAEVNKGN